MKHTAFLGILVSCAAFASLADQPDPRVRTYVWPTRVVWCTNATDAALLTGGRFGQVPEGTLPGGTGCTLRKASSNDVASVVLDFGRELHGGVQIGNGLPKGRKLVRLRFGDPLVGFVRTPVFGACGREGEGARPRRPRLGGGRAADGKGFREDPRREGRAGAAQG